MSNVIEITFGGATSAVTDEKAYQYDYGQELLFTDLTLPEYFEVHFSNIKIGKASTTIGHDNKVTIPDVYLRTGMPVYGWVYLHETPADGETAYSFRVPVIQRARPSDQLTPEQESLIATILALLEHPTEHIEEEIQAALAAAKASGEFDGYSPTVDITEDEDGTYIVTVTDADGEHEYELNAGSYKNLSSKPSINGVTLDGNKNFTQLGLASASDLASALSQLTQDSEVQNIRTGDDGVTYESAGIAVRTQFSNLKSEINNIVASGNVYDGKYTAGYYVNQGNGNLVSASGWNATDFVPLESGETYYIGGGVSTYSFACYNSRKTFVDVRSNPDVCTNNNLKAVIIVPSNVSYIRLSANTSVLPYICVSKKLSADQYTTLNDFYAKKNRYFSEGLAFVDGKYDPAFFVAGTFNTDYNPTSYSASNSVSSREMMYAPYDMTLVCDGSNINVHLFDDDGTHISGTGWVTTCSVSRGSNYKFSIRKTSDDTLENIVSTVTVTADSMTNEIAPLFVQSSCPPIVYQCRDGRVTNSIPPNSKYAIQATAKNQYDKIRFSVAKTTDGQFVCVHDNNINGLAVNPDGTAISTTIATQSCTLAELNAYDWGLKFGAKYAGLQVPMLADSLKLATAYGLSVALDFKFSPSDSETEELFALLAKTNQTNAILIGFTIPKMVAIAETYKYFSYYFSGTEEQISANTYWFDKMKTPYNKVYIQPSPFGQAPSDSVIELCAENNLDLYMTPIEGINALTAMGFDKGISLFECHYIENIKNTVRNYADSLVG